MQRCLFTAAFYRRAALFELQPFFTSGAGGTGGNALFRFDRRALNQHNQALDRFLFILLLGTMAPGFNDQDALIIHHPSSQVGQALFLI